VTPVLRPAALAVFSAIVALPPGAAAGPRSSPVKWERQFDEALKKAKLAGKPVLIDFWAEWCGWCHRLDKTTYVDPAVVERLEGFVPVKVNTEGTRRETDVALRYDVSSLPTLVFVTPAGRQIARVNGFQGPGTFPHTLDMAREDARKVMSWEGAIEKDPKDAAALSSLGVHLFEQEFYEDSREMLYRATAADTDRPAEARRKTRMLLAIIQNYDKKYPEAESLLKEALGLKPPADDEAKLLFILSRTYLGSNRQPEARKTLQTILRDHGQSPIAQKARDSLATLDRPN
jgi:thioredoxin-like negative regulator of GroEL